MKILSWNVNGYRSAYSKGLPAFLEKESPDIVCLQEIKADEKALADHAYALQGYDPYHSVASKKGYSGVTTFVRAGLVPKAVQRGIGIQHFDSEGRFVILSFEDFDLYNVYYPSGTSGDLRQEFKYKFLESISAHIAALDQKKRDRIVMCGDFNICHREIDIHHPETATKLGLTGFLPEERKWMDSFEALGFVDTFRSVHGPKPKSYTWWSFRANSRAKNLGWRIDYIWVSKKLSTCVQTASIFDSVRGSDHCPISVELTGLT